MEELGLRPGSCDDEGDQQKQKMGLPGRKRLMTSGLEWVACCQHAPPPRKQACFDGAVNYIETMKGRSS